MNFRPMASGCIFTPGWDSGHNSKERIGGIDVSRNEGLVSLSGPKNGDGVVITC